MLTARYTQGAELPDLAIEWRDRTGGLVQFGATAHSFQLRVGHAGTAAVLTKTTGITGTNGAETDPVTPNVLIGWAVAGELNTITPGTYDAVLTATRTSDSKDRKMRFRLIVEATPA